MGIMSDLSLKLSANTGELKSGLADAQKSLNNFGNEAKTAAQKITDSFKGINSATSSIKEMKMALTSLKGISFAGKTPEEIKAINTEIGRLTSEMKKLDAQQRGATASVSGLAKGAATASASIKSSFAGLAGLANPLMSQMGALPSIIMSGVGAFKAMIPAINSTKMALISTGIGAIVVAIGLAFSALTSYLSGTSEGANKLKVMFSYVSGAVTALMNRIKYLGSALFSLMTGDIEGFKKSIKEAFEGGFFDEVKKSAEESQDITKAQIDLDKQRRALRYEEYDNMLKVAQLKEIAKNRDVETNETLEERLSAAKQLRDIELDTNTKAAAIAKAQFALDTRRNAQKAFLNKEDKDRVLDSYGVWKTAEAKKSEDLANGNKIVATIRRQQAKDDRAQFQDEKEQLKIVSDLRAAGTDLEMEALKDATKTKKAEKLLEIEDWRRTEIDKIKAIKATTDEQINEQKRLIDATNKQADVKVKKANIESAYGDQQKLIDEEKADLDTRAGLLDSYFNLGMLSTSSYFSQLKQLNDENKRNELADLQNSLNQQLVTREEFEQKKKALEEKYRLEGISLTQEETRTKTQIRNDDMNATMQGFGDLAGASEVFFGEQNDAYKAFAIGQAIVSTYLAAASIMANTAKLGPIAMAISMAGTIAMGLANVAKISGAFANGGIVGGNSYTGDKVPIAVNSGEMILNGGQQARLFAMANGSNSSNGRGGTVEFEIRGDKLVGVLNNYNKKMIRTR